MKPHVIFVAIVTLAAVPSTFAQCTGGQVVTSFGPNGSNGYVQISPQLNANVPAGGPEGMIRDPSSGAFYAVAALAGDASNNAINSLVRLKPGGAMDTGFAGIGFVVPQGQPDTAGSAVAVDGSGNAIVVSWNNQQLTVNRYSPTGVLDPTFGSSGVATAPLLAFSPSGPMNVAIGGDGSVYVAAFGSNQSPPQRYPAVVKFTPSGSLDTTFGSGGYSLFDTVDRGKATDIIVLPSGSILVGGRLGDSSNTHNVFYVARLLPDGALDPTFGPVTSPIPGVSTYDFGPNLLAVGRKMALRPDGRIVLVGGLTDPNTGIISGEGVVQFLPNGLPDSSFGTAGAVTISFGANSVWFPHVALQNNGKILLSGYLFTEPTQTFSNAAVARLTSSGAVDTTFGVNGIATLSPPSVPILPTWGRSPTIPVEPSRPRSPQRMTLAPCKRTT